MLSFITNTPNVKNAIEAILNDYYYSDKTLHDYYVLSVILIDTENGDEYTAERGFDHVPTDDDLRTVAEENWREFNEGDTDESEKENVIEDYIKGYIIVKTADVIAAAIEYPNMPKHQD